MAYTSVIPVRRLDRAVKYVMNKEKTTAVSLQDALDYAANRDKTEQSCFESSYKVNPDSQRIQQITAALKQLRQEERLCRKIAEQSLEVQQHLTEARRDRAEQQQREQEHERDRRPNIDLTL